MNRFPKRWLGLLALSLLVAAPAARAQAVKEAAEDIKDNTVAAARHVGKTAKSAGRAVGAGGKSFGKGVVRKGREIGTGTGHRVKSAYGQVKGNVKRSVKAVEDGRRDPPDAPQGPDPAR